MRLQRLRARLRTATDRGARSERGAVLYEVVIFMAVIMIVSGAYVTSNASMTNVVKRAQSFDIGNEAAHGVLEEIQAMPWNELALPGNPSASATKQTQGWRVLAPAGSRNAMTEVCSRSSDCSTGSNVVIRTVRGTAVSITIDIWWKSDSTTRRPECEPTVTAACETAGGVGTKIIQATVQWQANGVTQTRVQKVERTVTPVEASIVPGLPGSAGPTPTGFATPTTSSSPTALDTFTG